MFRKYHPQAGARPGTLLISAEAQPTQIRIVRYSRDAVSDEKLTDGSQLPTEFPDDEVCWIDIQGFGDEALLQRIAELYQIHPLAMEDMVNVPQRPKAELHSKQLLAIGRIVTMPNALNLSVSQIGLVMGANYVITFQEKYSDRFEPIVHRLACPTARLRRHGAGYLAYAVLDTAVDTAYPVLETLGDQLELLERQVMVNPNPTLLRQITSIRNRLVNVRRAIWPQRDAVQALLVLDHDYISDEIKLFLRNTYEHCVQTSEVVDMYLEMSSGLLNTYLSSVAHRSNEVMKTLTIMSSIFVPLTFIAGIYGMNFENMPELNFAWSYPMIWCLMLGTAVGMLWFFRCKGWISADDVTGVTDESFDPATGAKATIDMHRTRTLDHDLVKSLRDKAEPEVMRRAS